MGRKVKWRLLGCDALRAVGIFALVALSVVAATTVGYLIWGDIGKLIGATILLLLYSGWFVLALYSEES